MPRTHAENRYRFAIKRGHSEERAAWLRDNDPDFCEFHPERKSEFAGKRRCPECAEKDREAVEERRATKILTRSCKKCGKEFGTTIIANRKNCHDCHLSAGERKKQRANKVKVKAAPKPKPQKPSLPSTWEAPAKVKSKVPPVKPKTDEILDPLGLKDKVKRIEIPRRFIGRDNFFDPVFVEEDDCPKRVSFMRRMGWA